MLKDTVRLLLVSQSPTVWAGPKRNADFLINRQSGNGGFYGNWNWLIINQNLIGIGFSRLETIHLQGCHQIGFLTAFLRTKDFG